MQVTGIHPLILTQFQRDCERHKVQYTIYAKDTIDGQLFRYVQYSLIPVDVFDIPPLDVQDFLVITTTEGKYERSLVVRLRSVQEVKDVAARLLEESIHATEAAHHANDATEAVSPATRPSDD